MEWTEQDALFKKAATNRQEFATLARQDAHPHRTLTLLTQPVHASAGRQPRQVVGSAGMSLTDVQRPTSPAALAGGVEYRDNQRALQLAVRAPAGLAWPLPADLTERG